MGDDVTILETGYTREQLVDMNAEQRVKDRYIEADRGWCSYCGAGNDRLGYAHLSSCRTKRHLDRAISNSPPACPDLDQEQPHEDEMNLCSLPTDAQARKNAPIARGVLDYFPLAIVAVAELSRIGNEQHNPGEPMHWAKEKSTDEADCIVRHLIDRGKMDTDGVRHSTKVAWRALALLQRELEAKENPA